MLISHDPCLLCISLPHAWVWLVFFNLCNRWYRIIQASGTSYGACETDRRIRQAGRRASRVKQPSSSARKGSIRLTRRFRRFTIKGQANEEAVLCTNSKTYALRSVALSNSVLVVTPNTGKFPLDVTTASRESVVIRDELHEILELSPAVPRLHKLIGLLRGREYDESDEGGHNEKVSRSSRSKETHLLIRRVACFSRRITTPLRKLKASYKRATRSWIVVWKNAGF